MQLNEILIYTDIFDNTHEVIFLELSAESGNLKVMHKERGEIWLREKQVKRTGRINEDDKALLQKKASWTIGDPVPAHLIKEKKGRKR
jgi:hypothetical protein